MDKTVKNNVMLLLFFCVPAAVWFIFRLKNGSVVFPGTMVFLVSVIVSPVAEEIIFRFFIQNNIHRLTEKKLFFISVSNLATSVLFSLFHLFVWSTGHSFLVFFPSLAFGFIYEKTGRLRYAVLLHGVYNLNVFIL